MDGKLFCCLTNNNVLTHKCIHCKCGVGVIILIWRLLNVAYESAIVKKVFEEK